MLQRFLTLLRRLSGRLRSLEPLNAELEACLEILVDEKVAQGLSPSEARRLARLELGGVQQVKERVHDSTPSVAVESFLQDLRVATRSAVRSPLFSLTGILLIATSVGLVCAAYTVVDAVLLRKLAVPAPDQLVLVRGIPPAGSPASPVGTPLTARVMREVGRDTTDISQLFGFRSLGLQGTVNGTTRTLTVIGVSGDFFASQATVPALGRVFGSDEQEPVAVISDRLWLSEFARDPAVIGQTLTLGERRITIVGVASPDFRGMNASLLWHVMMPLMVMHETTGRANPDDYSLEVGARLKPGVTIAAFEASLSGRWSSIIDATTPRDTTLALWRERKAGGAEVTSLERGNLPEIPGLRRPLLMTLGLALLIFTGACVTMGLLAVARSLKHQREAAIRLAIGGTRLRVLRPYVLEHLLLGIGGLVAGLLLAQWLTTMGAGYLPRGAEAWPIRIDVRVLALAVTLALVMTVVGILCGVVSVRGEASAALLQQGHSGGRVRVRLRTILLTLQCALTFVMLQYALTYASELTRLSRVSLGFNPHDVHIYEVAGKLPRHAFDDQTYFTNLLAELRALPRVQSASAVGGGTTALGASGTFQPVHTDDGRRSTTLSVCVFPEYFATLQIPIVAGRDFSAADRTAAVITGKLARALYPDGSALGHVIQTGKLAPLEVIGVVGDVWYSGQWAGDVALVFLPCLEYTKPWPASYAVQLVTRSTMGLSDLEPRVRQVVDRRGVHYLHRSFDEAEVVAGLIDEERLLASLSGAFGGAFVLLTGAGLYAFCSYLLVLRTWELAVRAALGAGPLHIVRTLWREMIVVLFAGVAIGATATVALRRVLVALVEGAPTGQSKVFVGLIIMLAIAVGAGIVPTIRAIRINIARALRAA